MWAKFIAFVIEIKLQISNYNSQINHNDQNSKIDSTAYDKLCLNHNEEYLVISSSSVLSRCLISSLPKSLSDGKYLGH